MFYFSIKLNTLFLFLILSLTSSNVHADTKEWVNEIYKLTENNLHLATELIISISKRDYKSAEKIIKGNGKFNNNTTLYHLVLKGTLAQQETLYKYIDDADDENSTFFFPLSSPFARKIKKEVISKDPEDITELSDEDTSELAEETQDAADDIRENILDKFHDKKEEWLIFLISSQTIEYKTIKNFVLPFIIEGLLMDHYSVELLKKTIELYPNLKKEKELMLTLVNQEILNLESRVYCSVKIIKNTDLAEDYINHQKEKLNLFLDFLTNKI